MVITVDDSAHEIIIASLTGFYIYPPFDHEPIGYPSGLISFTFGDEFASALPIIVGTDPLLQVTDSSTNNGVYPYENQISIDLSHIANSEVDRYIDSLSDDYLLIDGKYYSKDLYEGQQIVIDIDKDSSTLTISSLTGLFILPYVEHVATHFDDAITALISDDPLLITIPSFVGTDPLLGSNFETLADGVVVTLDHYTELEFDNYEALFSGSDDYFYLDGKYYTTPQDGGKQLMVLFDKATGHITFNTLDGDDIVVAPVIEEVPGAPTTNDDTTDDDKKTLSGGAIAGIAVGGTAGLSLIPLLIILLAKKLKKKVTEDDVK
jgi:hypothetical protein